MLTLGLSIVMKVRNIIGIQACPAESSILDYFEGRLKKKDQSEYERMTSHLGICEKCQQTLTDMAIGGSEASGQAIEDHLIQKKSN